MAKYTDKAPQVNELDDLAAGIRAYVITTYQTDTLPAEYCHSKNPTGNWCWILNDGNLPVGQFPSRNDAFEDALASLLHYRDVMGGKVGALPVPESRKGPVGPMATSIAHAKSPSPADNERLPN
jgi:hypothetical protein